MIHFGLTRKGHLKLSLESPISVWNSTSCELDEHEDWNEDDEDESFLPFVVDEEDDELLNMPVGEDGRWLNQVMYIKDDGE